MAHENAYAFQDKVSTKKDVGPEQWLLPGVLMLNVP